MKDWKGIAKSAGLDIPPADVERVVAPLNGLEEAFRPLANCLPPELEPSSLFFAEEESE